MSLFGALSSGVGAGASLAIDGYLIARDFGLTPFNQGGIPLGQNVPALLNDRPDKAREAVMPLTEETFLKFGEGNLKALERNKGKYVRLESEVLAQAIKKTNSQKAWWDPLGVFTGGDDSSGNEGKDDRSWWQKLFGGVAFDSNCSPQQLNFPSTVTAHVWYAPGDMELNLKSDGASILICKPGYASP